jgi:hypothetical protein
MSVQHANIGVVKKDLQLYYNREFSKSFRGESSTNLITNTVTSSGPWDGNLFNNWINATVTENVDMAPDGTMTAVRLTGGYARWTNSITVDASTTYTASIWLKNINLGVDPGINIATGLNGTLVSYVVANSTITRSTIANWRRVSVTYTIPASGVNQIQFGVRYEGDYPNQNSILVWGAQFEKKAYMTQYSNLATDYFSRNETITNLLTSTYSSLPTNWSVDSSGFGVTGTYSYIENNSAIRIVDVNTNTRFLVANISGFSASTTYTFSVKYRKVSGTPTLRFQIQWLNSSNVQIGSISFPTTPQVSIYNIDGWQLAKFTVTSPVNTAKVTWFIQDGDDYTGYTHSYDLKEPQIQTGTYPTKWTSNTSTANTLTSGGGLLDISGNNVNADLTNVSFNSTGYIFTGASSNRIQFTTPTSFIYSAAGKTVLMWVNYGTSSYVGFCGLGNAANGQSFNLRSAAAATAQFLGFMGYNADYDPSAGPQINNNVWHLIGATFDAYGAGNLKLYVDGVNIASTTSTLNTAPEASNIGYIGRSSHTGAEGYFTGQVGQFMMYNRALSADEVSQIFNSQRKTYGV